MKATDKITGVSHIAKLSDYGPGYPIMGFINRDGRVSIDIVTSTLENGIKGKEISYLEAMELLMKQSDKETEVEKFTESYDKIIKAREKCINYEQ